MLKSVKEAKMKIKGLIKVKEFIEVAWEKKIKLDDVLCFTILV
jgi:hypothetical protein